MVKITEELVRKRAEHNECIIGTLEELSLHQEDIEKIENLNNWCKDLQILYLQANLISKIENLNKLKKLQYLNLALNNIEVIENLSGCEFLEKLDLTLNFIWKLDSVKSLKNNIHLRQLYLTGNPCSDYENYRDYVIAELPQISDLDCVKITKSEQIKAKQKLPEMKDKIFEAQDKYRRFREEQKERLASDETHLLSDDEYWKSKSENTPESRIEMAKRSRKSKRCDEKEEIKTREVRLFSSVDQRPLNVNQAKLDFSFSDENPAEYVLDVAVYKYMDSNFIDVDLQPIYVKIAVKGKVFQMVFPQEILIEKSTCQRSQITGHLVLKMPVLSFQQRYPNYKPFKANNNKINKKETGENENKNVYLEVEDKHTPDIANIVKDNKIKSFVDDPDVPPLEYVKCN